MRNENKSTDSLDKDGQGGSDSLSRDSLNGLDGSDSPNSPDSSDGLDDSDSQDNLESQDSLDSLDSHDNSYSHDSGPDNDGLVCAHIDSIDTDLSVHTDSIDTDNVVRVSKKKQISKFAIWLILSIGMVALAVYLFSSAACFNKLRDLQNLGGTIALWDSNSANIIHDTYRYAFIMAISEFLSIMPGYAIMIIMLLNYPKEKEMRALKELWITAGFYLLSCIAAGLYLYFSENFGRSEIKKLFSPFIYFFLPLGIITLIFVTYKRRNRRRSLK